MDHLSHFNMIMNIIALINEISNLLKKESLMPNWEVELEIGGIYVQSSILSFFLFFLFFLSLSSNFLHLISETLMLIYYNDEIVNGEMVALLCNYYQLMQNDLCRMQLPDTIRLRIQTAMPILLPSVRCFVSCQLPSVPVAALASLQPSISIPGVYSGHLSPPQRNTVPLTRTATNASAKYKLLPSQLDHDMEIDPWTLLEDGAGSGPSSSNTAVIGSGDHANLRASSWLKGAVRVRRSDLTYIGAVDEDS